MRITTIATAALLAVSSATLANAETQLGSSTISNTEVKATHMVDAETSVLTINPEFTYAAMPALDLTLGTTLNLWEDVNNTDIQTNLTYVRARTRCYICNPRSMGIRCFMNYDPKKVNVQILN